MTVAIGEFVPSGAPLFAINGDPANVNHRDVTDAIVLTLERTLGEDVAYGLRLLVDIAERSLADSALQDPTTTVQPIDRLHDCLRQTAPRPFPDGTYADELGQTRLILRVMDWDAYVRLAFDEIRLVGAGSPPVSRRLHAALDDLKNVAPPHRQSALDDQLRRLNMLTDQTLLLPEDVSMASQSDPQGIGVGAGRVR